MVFFSCNLCGTPLKKNQVDKHVYQCRTQSVSCMDCQKDFSLKECGSHIKCISEEEKYGGEGWKAPSNFNKGEKKQQAWVDTVNTTLKNAGGSLSPPSRNLLQTLSKHDNVPRKKAKFMNFINNIAKHRFDHNTLDNVWNLLEEQWKAQAAANASVKKDKSESSEKENGDTVAVANSNGHSVQVTTIATATVDPAGVQKMSKREKKEARKQKQHKEEKKEKRINVLDDVEENNAETNGNTKISKKERKKRKRSESETESENKKSKDDCDPETLQNPDPPEENDDIEPEVEESSKDFKWGAAIREVLLHQPGYEISLKKLRKKVITEYYAVIGDSKGIKTQQELISKLNKKLKKQHFKVFKENVKLVV